MTIDERIEARAMNLDVASRTIQELRRLAAQDGETIRAAARIPEINEKRLTDLEGGD